MAVLNDAERLGVLRGLRVTEKSETLRRNRQYVFKVRRDAGKRSIKRAVEEGFDVQVESVHVLNVKGKNRRFRNVSGRISGWKKAYVTLKPDNVIEHASME